MDNRRNFLINFAKEKGFDPLSPSQWSSYASSSIKVTNKRGGKEERKGGGEEERSEREKEKEGTIVNV